MTTFKPLPVPRYLDQVIDLMLQVIPPNQNFLRSRLEDSKASNRYRAPEMQDFTAVAKILFAYCNGQESLDWVVTMLKIWRNEEFSLIPQNSVG